MVACSVMGLLINALLLVYRSDGAFELLCLYRDFNKEVVMRRYSSSPALGNTVRLKLDSVTESLLRSATSRSGRSRGFEVFFRVRDHLNRFPMFRVMDNPDFSKSFFVTVRFDEETNLKLINAKNRSGWCKTYEVRERLHDHLIKFPDFYNAEMVEVIPNNFD